MAAKPRVPDRDGPFSSFDIHCMKRAFSLAKRGAGKTSPNPMVGAVLVKDGLVIGQGWHRRYGEAHAEAEAIRTAREAGFSPQGAELYCTLEPCCFTAPDKHQRPCTGLILESGVRRVVIANQDPHPKVKGGGERLLREAGLRVQTGLCAGLGEELNRAFFTFHRHGRPFVHLKIAQSLDGKIAAASAANTAGITSPNVLPGAFSGPSAGGGGQNQGRWITGEAARALVHRMRAFYDAVLIGRGTVLADDPELTVRLTPGRNPLRVILDSRLSLPEDAKILTLPDPEKTLIFHGPDASVKKIKRLRDRGVQVFPLERGPPENPGLSLDVVLAALGERGVRSVLVEGGAGVFGSFLRQGLWDRLSVFIAPFFLGDGVSALSGLGSSSLTGAPHLAEFSFRRIGNDLLLEGRRKK